METFMNIAALIFAAIGLLSIVVAVRLVRLRQPNYFFNVIMAALVLGVGCFALASLILFL